MRSLGEIIEYTNSFLRVDEIEDWPGALNGLQIENSGAVTRIGAAVDASTRTLSMAAERGVTLLLVHHGLFWGGVQPIAGILGRQVRSAIASDIALYSAHLPLDVHPVIGNNALLAAAIQLEETSPFLETKGQLVGVRGTREISRDDLAQRLCEAVGGAVTLVPGGPTHVQTVGVSTGGAGDLIQAAAKAGVDTFITGEAPHWAGVAAHELGVNLLLAGHYATETFGVRALARHLGDRFSVPWEFVDCPTGL